MMKVLQVIPGLGEGGGGAERSMLSMMSALTAGADIHVVSFTDRTELGGELRAAGARTTLLSARSRPAVTMGLAQLIHREQPDLVHTTLVDADLTGRVAAAVARTPVVSSIVNDRYGEGGSRSIRLKRLGVQVLDASTARLVVRFHALTEHAATCAVRRLGIAPDRIDVIARGRSRASLGLSTGSRRAAIRCELGVGNDRPLLIAAARHEQQKGLDVLLEAMPIILRTRPDALLLIGGRNGGLTEMLERMATPLVSSGHVRFIGPRSDVSDLMCAADVWCVPSRWEGLGSILIEAMALGVPTIASDLPPIRETAGEDPCFRLVPPAHPRHLAEAALELLADRGERERLGVLAQSRFELQYQVEDIAAQMLAFYDRSIAQSRLTRSKPGPLPMERIAGTMRRRPEAGR